MREPRATAVIHVGDAVEVLATLPDESVHCCVTSPPYWGLRDYGVDGQLGSEPTFNEYLEHMMAVFEQVHRVLRRDGTLWLNLGDSYAGQGGGSNGHHAGLRRWRPGGHTVSKTGFKRKDLVGVPWRVAFALQEAGWWLRRDVVWFKTNSMPDSAPDRPGSAHEFVFQMTKASSYFYDQHAVRQPARFPEGPGAGSNPRPGVDTNGGNQGNGVAFGAGPLRNLRDVWVITTKPFPGAHFATFPPDLVDLCVRASTSAHGCCTECGAPWRRLLVKGEANTEWQRACGADANGEYHGEATKDYGDAKAQDAAATKARILDGMRERVTAGWSPSCECPEPCSRGHAVVLDPFSGAGTTGLVCAELGRDYVGIEINPEYAEMSRRRIDGCAPLFVDTQCQEASA